MVKIVDLEMAQCFTSTILKVQHGVKVKHNTVWKVIKTIFVHVFNYPRGCWHICACIALSVNQARAGLGDYDTTRGEIPDRNIQSRQKCCILASKGTELTQFCTVFFTWYNKQSALLGVRSFPWISWIYKVSRYALIDTAVVTSNA